MDFGLLPVRTEIRDCDLFYVHCVSCCGGGGSGGGSVGVMAVFGLGGVLFVVAT